MPDGPKPGDWRQQGSTSPPKTGTRAWQSQSTPAAATRAPMSRGTKLGIAGGTMAVVLGLLVVVLRWLIPIKPACLILLGASYDDNLSLPHNVAGWKALNDLSELADKSGTLSSWVPWADAGKMRLQFGPRTIDTQNPWDKTWSQLPSDFAEKTALIVISLHGGADGKEAYFLANDGRGSERIPLAKVLQDLDGPSFKDKNKVLILDSTHVQGHWPSGLLYNNFAAQLKSLEKKIDADPGLVVLCGSDVDQRAWASEEWRRSIFLHYVIEGLKGAADTDHNARINALELFEYVKGKVKTWVQANREAAQTPILLGGEDRAADIDLVQIAENYTEQAPGSAPGSNFVPPSELEQAWRDCQALRESVPSPAVYQPQLWRQYQDTVLRYEQLLRFGDPTQKSAELRSTLGKLRETILVGARVDVTAPALHVALPMAQVLGFKDDAKAFQEMRTQFDRLWEQSPEEREKSWAKIQGLARSDEKIARLRLSAYLLQQLTRKENLTRKDFGASPGGEETQARTLLRLIEKLGGQRSAETHFLVMLLQDLDPAAPFTLDDLKLAVSTRLLAEEAALAQSGPNQHPYAELIFPWLRARIDRADDMRRRGEDWLFGSSKKAQEQATKGLGEATTKYQETRPDAELLRQALDLRDRVCADLPYYAEWVARQEGVNTEKLQVLMGQVERINRHAQALSERLRNVQGKDLSESTPADDDNPKGLAPKALITELVRKIRDDFSDNDKGLQVSYKKVCEGLKEVHLQSRFHEIEDALAIPLIEDTAVRMTLLRNSRGYSSQLNAGTLKPASISLDEKGHKEWVQRQQKLALAVLGPRHVRDLALDTAAETPWRDAAVQNGQAIGRFWRQLPDAINKNVADSLAATDLARAQSLLVDADLRCRLLHAGGVAYLTTDPFNAPDGLRRLDLHDLLVWQAKRTLGDHWYGDTESLEKTFYMPTALACLKAAKRLAEGKTDDEDHTRKRQARARKVEEEVTLAGIQLENLSQPHWTSELRFPLRWKVVVEEGVPPGVPMTWLKVEKPLQVTEAKLGRKALENWPPDPIAYTLERPSEDATPRGQSTLQGLYRGQRWQSVQEVMLHREPKLIAYNVPPPPRSAVALRMDKDFTYGAVSIVLDCSGSMGYHYPEKTSKDMRFDFARKAMRIALEAIPDGTYVSLVAFRYDETQKKTTIRLVQAPKLWKAGQFEDFMDRIDGLRPPIIGGQAFGSSPIAKAIVEARRKGFPGNYTGPKVILALTDGDDNDSFQDFDPTTQRPAYNRAVQKLLNSEFDESGVEVQMVCFNNPLDIEGKNAEEQFKKPIDNMIPPGNFVVQPDGAQLAATLEQAIRPHLRLYQGSVPLKDFKPLPASLPDREIEWRGTKPGNYEAIVHRFFQNLYLEPGDLLEFVLKRQNNDTILERKLLGIDNRYKLGNQEHGDWSVSVLQNQVEQRTGEVKQLVAIEEKPAAFKPGNLLKQIHPGFLWLEVAPRGDKKPGQLRWHKEFTYSAPTFRLSTKTWPYRDEQPVPSEVKAWWSPKAYPDNEAYTYFFEWSPPKFRNVRKVVGATGFTIESIDVEEHKVAETPWTGDRTLKRCVVVRVAHDPNRPVWIQLRGEKGTPGEEHHYYSDVAKYTAYFWGLSNPDVERLTLNVISIEDFKNGNYGAAFVLPAPTTTPGPLPVLRVIQDR